VTTGPEDGSRAREANGGAHRTDQEKSASSDAVDDRHGEHRKEQVGSTDGHCLKVGGDLTESGAGENVVQVIEDRIDARELVEDRDGKREEEGQAIARGKEAFLTFAFFELKSLIHGAQFGIDVLFANRI
jgi:hypothetical protein